MKARSFRCSSSSHKILRFCGSPVVAVMANTSPGDISHSDGHSIFKVQVLLQEQFNEKMRSFPYIQEVGKERKTGWISTLRDRKKEGYAMQIKLTIQERLKDLRVERGLTLEQLAEQTGLSKSALGKYEADDFKDISPFSIVTLAKFYGVSTDYLLGMTETKITRTQSWMLCI